MESLTYGNRQRLARTLRERLIDDLGRRHTRLIIQETGLLDSLILEQKNYTEILETFRQLIQHPHSRHRSFLNPSPLPEPPQEQQGIDLDEFLASHSMKAVSQNYEYLRRRFQQETKRLNAAAEKTTRQNYTMPYSLDYSAKLDEIRAMEVQQLEEERLKQREVEQGNQKKQQISQTRKALDEQVHAKQAKALLLRQAAAEEKHQLDTRLFNQNYLDILRTEREDQKRKDYAEALKEQLRAKASIKNEYNRLVSLEKSLRNSRSINSTPDPRHLKNTRGLAQYGNIMLYAK